MFSVNAIHIQDGLTQKPEVHIPPVVRYSRLDVTLPVVERVASREYRRVEERDGISIRLWYIVVFRGFLRGVYNSQRGFFEFDTIGDAFTPLESLVLDR